jgi:hypothetical protein
MTSKLKGLATESENFTKFASNGLYEGTINKVYIKKGNDLLFGFYAHCGYFIRIEDGKGNLVREHWLNDEPDMTDPTLPIYPPVADISTFALFGYELRELTFN